MIPPPAPQHAGDLDKLRAAAVALEASFLAEMLTSAGLGETKGSFSGGTGEAQFASFLRREQAEQMAQSGGIGLAEQIFESLKGRVHG
ncbi:MAG: rod-binding protein [Rhodobacteraceae bacterium]|nr:rod-binding protein [Paracoccaceae bacterium]